MVNHYIFAVTEVEAMEVLIFKLLTKMKKVTGKKPSIWDLLLIPQVMNKPLLYMPIIKPYTLVPMAGLVLAVPIYL
jgi:hypothetical protein